MCVFARVRACVISFYFYSSKESVSLESRWWVPARDTTPGGGGVEMCCEPDTPLLSNESTNNPFLQANLSRLKLDDLLLLVILLTDGCSGTGNLGCRTKAH